MAIAPEREKIYEGTRIPSPVPTLLQPPPDLEDVLTVNFGPNHPSTHGVLRLIVGEGMKVGPTDSGGEVDMGPVISQQHRDKVSAYLDVATKEGANVALDGRKRDLPADGFLLGPSVVDATDALCKALASAH